MKILSIDEEYIELLLLNMDIHILDDRISLEEKFRDIFLKLKELYAIDIEGYYTIDIYVDDMMGMVVVIEKEDVEYFDIFDDQVDMRIAIHQNSSILYEIEDNFEILNHIDLDMYVYKNKFYGKLIKPLSLLEIGYLLEYSINILYGNQTKLIVNSMNYMKQ